MKVAIHNRKGSFSDRWVDFCIKKEIPFKLVNCYDNNIIEQLIGCNVLMWHHHHADYRDALFAKELLFSLEHAGVKVFPDFNTAWHFDDKVGQKYLLEAIGAPLVPSYVFYNKSSAVKWANETSYPKVFKLRGGAGASNVSLVNDKDEALKKIKQAFGKGFSQFNRVEYVKDQYNKMIAGKETFRSFFKAIVRLFISTEFAKMRGREKGYVYFQDFIPNNNSDTRIIIVNDKAFALKRGVRKNDFRASGSGDINYDRNGINLNALKISFKVNKILQTQSIAFDFVMLDETPLIVEISYGYAINAYDRCPGYWDKDLNWHEGNFNPQEWMVENLIKK